MLCLETFVSKLNWYLESVYPISVLIVKWQLEYHFGVDFVIKNFCLLFKMSSLFWRENRLDSFINNK